MIKQKHFMDIENLREEDTELRHGNGHGFVVGDIIQISTKVDGSNASIAWNEDTNSIIAFSRKRQLSYDNTLRGFWNYVQTIDQSIYNGAPKNSVPKSWIIFGEWLVSHKVQYEQDYYNKWYVYDIYDKETEEWIDQPTVEMVCKDFGFNYINELYYGPFISWEHVRGFLNHHWKGTKGEEGVVVKNMTRLNCPDTRLPFYLKIVNDDFKESMKTREKVIDPNVEAAKSESQRIVESIVTKNRVEKELFKMRDEGILPEKLTPYDMGLVARYLPKRIYDDCVKEEKELVVAAGEYFGKMCSAQAMKLARGIITG